MLKTHASKCNVVLQELGKLFVRPVTLHVIMPIVIGAAIYLLWRTSSLEVFRWFSAIGLSETVVSAREISTPLRTALPDWFLYSLPNGLWAYAFSSAILLVWAGNSRAACLIWIGIAISLGIGSELGQLAGWVPGTFEATDLLFYLAGFALPLFCFSWRQL